VRACLANAGKHEQRRGHHRSPTTVARVGGITVAEIAQKLGVDAIGPEGLCAGCSRRARSARTATALENDGLRWPRRDGLKWPHLASVVVGVDLA
jgi:hypothetical protein